MTEQPRHSTPTDQAVRSRAVDGVGVFVIDDNEGYRRVATEVVLANDQFTLLGAAASWSEARQHFDSGPRPDLVLLDINLGEESGIDVATELTSQWPDIKVVLISTLAISDLPTHSRSCGASGFLPKSQLGPRQVTEAWLGAYDWNS